MSGRVSLHRCLALLASGIALQAHAEGCQTRPYSAAEMALYQHELKIVSALPAAPAGFEGGMYGMPSSPQEPTTTAFYTPGEEQTAAVNCIPGNFIDTFKFGSGYPLKATVRYDRPMDREWALQSVEVVADLDPGIKAKMDALTARHQALTDQADAILKKSGEAASAGNNQQAEAIERTIEPLRAQWEALDKQMEELPKEAQHQHNLKYLSDRFVEVTVAANAGGSFAQWGIDCNGVLKPLAVAGADAWRCVIDPRGYQRHGDNTVIPDSFNETIFVLFGGHWRLKKVGRFADPGQDNSEVGTLETTLDDTPPRQRIHNILLTISADPSRSDAVLKATNLAALRDLIQPAK